MYDKMRKNELLKYKERLLDSLGKLEVSADEMENLPLYVEFRNLDTYLYEYYGI